MLVILISILLQSTVLHPFAAPWARPDLILVLTAVSAVWRGALAGAAVGFGAGLLLDIFVGRAVGLSALTKGLIGLLLGFGEGFVFKHNYVLPLVAGFLATLGDRLLFLAIGYLFGLPAVDLRQGVRFTAGTAVANALLTVLVYFGVFRLDRSVFNRGKE